ncbi:aminoglycoside phosphotransferase family protein [Paenibacillus alkaliterrae]|uniref:phosphotransferase family protein n=1 Tax=Paenibacillus alkaliterrae TaxID=320909 RepID=UPI001F40D69D|nr:aminoglycoside phosphotransferase family protein [Paenibacillus alkaliterrae]MCF2941003.1 aminoglycoside phosphotransferase family protein [Paenibacillus alkaliterrae]
MTAYEKPSLDIGAVKRLLEQRSRIEAEDIAPVSGGNLSSVFFFKQGGKEFVIRFSDLAGSYDRERYISRLLASQGVPYPRVLDDGKLGSLSYSISEKLEGGMLADVPEEQRGGLMPDLVKHISAMNRVDVSSTRGYGWLDGSGGGTYETWEQFAADVYKEEQNGTFWENWTELYHTTFLEKDVFEECYARLMAYAPYNAPHRHFVHNDCHAWNLLTDGRTITGIIDANCIYGDFLIDLSIAESAIPGHDVIQAFRDYQERQGIAMPHFKERLLGARHYKGLDGLRFYAKMGWRPAYDYLRGFLLNLTS